MLTFIVMKTWKLWSTMVLLTATVLTLLSIQINWLWQQADLKEDYFNQRLTMAICSAVEELSETHGVYGGNGSCAVQPDPRVYELHFDPSDKATVDSVIGYYLSFYKITLPYRITMPDPGNAYVSVPSVITTLNNSTTPEFRQAAVHINFPTKQELIISQMNGMFVVSILLLLILVTVFFVTIRALLAEQNIRAKTIEFINTMAHELKTPIANIDLSVSMLQRENIISSPQLIRYYSNVAYKENKRMKNQVEQVLGISNIERVLQKETYSRCDIHEIILSVTERFTLQLAATNGSILTELNATHSIVNGNYGQLSNALINLVDNAKTYSKGDPHVIIKTFDNNQTIHVMVIDNGIGIPADKQALVFDEFYRIPSGEDPGLKGAGIGLSLVKKVITQHGGSVALESTYGEGSCFTLCLPLIQL